VPSGARDGSTASGWPTTTVAPRAGARAGLVHRARDAVERGQVDDRCRPNRGSPASPAARAQSGSLSPRPKRNRRASSPQAIAARSAVDCCGVTFASTARRLITSPSTVHARRPETRPQHTLDLRPSARLPRPRRSRAAPRPAHAAPRRRHPPGRRTPSPAHEPGRPARACGAPTGEGPWTVVLERLRRPVAAAVNLRRTDQAAPPKPQRRSPASRRHATRARAEQAERDSDLAGTRHVRSQRGRRRDAFSSCRWSEDASRPGRASRRELGVQVLQAAGVEIALQLGVGGRAHEQRMPRGVDLVQEARLRDLRRANGAAEPLVSFEHTDLPALLRQQRGCDERVDPAPDRDRVVAPQVSPSVPPEGSSNGGQTSGFQRPAAPLAQGASQDCLQA
jgi:hypothetical protein